MTFALVSIEIHGVKFIFNNLAQLMPRLTKSISASGLSVPMTIDRDLEKHKDMSDRTIHLNQTDLIEN